MFQTYETVSSITHTSRIRINFFNGLRKIPILANEVYPQLYLYTVNPFFLTAGTREV